MADQAVWFKLWCSVLMDPALSNLDLADFGRWCKLGALLKQHGTAGAILIQSPALHLCSAFQVGTFDALLVMLQRLPGVITQLQTGSVTGVTVTTVTMTNWSRYQGDNSADRVRRFRERVTPKKRREEMRREVDEKRIDSTPPIAPPHWPAARSILAFLNKKTNRHYQPTRTNLLLIVARLKDGATEDQCRAVIGRKTAEWATDPKMTEFLRPATLFNATKFAQYQGELPATAFQPDPDNGQVR